MNDEWFENIKWSGECLQCREKNGGKCPDRECAEFNYNENGDKIPLHAWHADGDTVNKYRNKKE